MKKLFVSLFCLVAIAGFGGIIASAHAQTTQTAPLTPAEATQLQQELSTLKAKLLELRAQEAAQSPAQSASAATGAMSSPAATGSSLSLGGTALTATDIASLQHALSLLATALQGIQSEFSANPSLASGHEAAVLAALKSVGTTLASIGSSIAAASVVPQAQSGPAAVATAPSAAAGQSAPAATPPQGTTNAPSAEGTLPAPPAANTNPTNPQTNPQIAQMGNTFSFAHLNWPLIIVIILIVAAIALWLFWPGESDATKKLAKQAASVPSAPLSSAPAPAKQMPMMPHVARSQQDAERPQTPLAAAVAKPMEKQGSGPAPQAHSAQGRPGSPVNHGPIPAPQQRKPA